MVPLIGVSVLIQILCAVHCVRGGRNQMWLMVIIFLSLPGCFAYFLFEIVPDLAGRREVRLARAATARKLDPERDLRKAREALTLADTSANHIALADSLAELERWREAADEYRVGLDMAPGPDRGAMVRMARVCFELGQYGEARRLLETLPETWSQSERDRAELLLARVLDEQGESQRALELYETLGARLPGAEAQCRQAALLLKLGRRADAVMPLEETEMRLKRLDRAEKMRDRDMYDWAMRTLAELRAS